jgi:hypothetical protein
LTIDPARLRLRRVRRRSGLTCCFLVALVARVVDAQATAPLGERVRDNSRIAVFPGALQWLGDITTCTSLSCPQTATGEIALPMTSRVQLAAGGAAARSLDPRYGDWMIERRADLRYRTDRLSTWVGAVRTDGDALTAAWSASPRARVESGARFMWTNVDVALSLGAGRRPPKATELQIAVPPARADIVPDGVPTESARSTRSPWTSAEGRASWRAGAFVVSTIIGRATSRDTPASRWGSLEIARPTGRGTFAFLNAGVSPDPRVFGTPGRPHRSIDLGVRFSAVTLRAGGARTPETLAPAFVVQPASQGRYRLRIRIANADRVELASDCTEWQPIAMTRVAGDVWEIVLPAVTGPHFVNIRVDGGRWTAPPGLVPKSDDFGGSTGVFVIE